jgi:sugar phosphate isomerase/epimerase
VIAPTASSLRLPRIVLKARPTAAQLADRLRPPTPEGLEIYLDAADIAPPNWLTLLRDRMRRHSLPEQFVLLVEGPIRSLDGAFFDLSVDNPANRAVVERLAEFGQAVGARAACVHLIAPTDDLSGVGPDAADLILERCLPLARLYLSRCRDAGLTPTLENVPPVARMREARFMTSSVGAPPEHLARLGDALPGLRFTLDTSHAQLFLNAASAAAPEARFARLCASVAASSPVRTMAEFVRGLSGRIETVHVSDAEGLLGEGLPYGQGATDLDGALDLLLPEARAMVAEILEPDPDRSDNMRAAEARIRARREGRA